MTKTFEKDLNEKLNSEKVPMYITQKGCSLTRKTFIETNWIFDNYKNWHSDEEFQELLDKYSHLNDNYEKEVITSSKLESQIIDLKSQLQQQALTKTVEDFQGELEDLIDDILDDYISDLPFDGKKYKFIEKYAPQALPVVPECVAEWIECVKGKNNNALALLDDDNMPDDVNEWLFFQRNDDNINLILRAWLDGYTVEKPQLFYIELPNVYGSSDSVFVSKVENGTILEFTKGKNYALAFTEQEIKSIDERYWQFSVPVEDKNDKKF
ncbi:DUF1642 domain-containing protein [Lactococcus lactis]|uniref:DUF1642 domain-containing protein n=1 Tax=Lactococcus lactis TaxID=1358 RepID=UPI001E39F64D|nr:DUF1642 domain-containing protein [Lactococcus lactis]